MGARISEAVAIGDEQGAELRAVSLAPGGENVARIEFRNMQELPYCFDLDASTLRDLRLGLERIERMHAPPKETAPSADAKNGDAPKSGAKK